MIFKVAEIISTLLCNYITAEGCFWAFHQPKYPLELQEDID